MDLIQIYVDEDAAHRALVDALRSRGVTVLTALEAGLTGAPDEKQLAFAAERGCVLYSHNASDVHRLYTEWIGARQEHAGMILWLRSSASLLASSCAAFYAFGPRPVPMA